MLLSDPRRAEGEIDARLLLSDPRRSANEFEPRLLLSDPRRSANEFEPRLLLSDPRRPAVEPSEARRPSTPSSVSVAVRSSCFASRRAAITACTLAWASSSVAYTLRRCLAQQHAIRHHALMPSIASLLDEPSRATHTSTPVRDLLTAAASIESTLIAQPPHPSTAGPAESTVLSAAAVTVSGGGNDPECAQVPVL